MCFTCCKFQVFPPRWREAILRFILLFQAIIPFLGLPTGTMVLIIINHTAETRLFERLHIGRNPFVCGVLITKEPPRLDAAVVPRLCRFPCFNQFIIGNLREETDARK